MSVSGAFLKLEDASQHIQSLYRQNGLLDKTRTRRIARIVQLPAGTRLFKANQYREEWLRPMLSPWWSTVEPYGENKYGALDLVRMAEENTFDGKALTFRDLVRFISAVSLDWNTLNWYVEIVLAVDLYAFWGQFDPQKSIQSPTATGVVPTPTGNVTLQQNSSASGMDHYVDYGNGETSYLSPVLGGAGAWQLYIPNFDKHLIDPSHIINLSATNNAALERYLRWYR
jgi:hypothetical protein